MKSFLRTSILTALAATQAMGQVPPPDAVPPAEMLRGYLTSIASRQLAERREKVAAIRTRQEFETRRAEVRRKILEMMGGLPEVRTPLNLRTTGVLDRGGYRVEKVVYESQPGFYVTANLYVPQDGKPPYPAILHSVGHTAIAKTGTFYQGISLALVKSGFVVLTYDPVGQGERLVFYDADLGDSKVGRPTIEHQMVGVQSLLAGESIARMMVWDGMRGIDVLESLSYVDPKRIGVTGCSGGGTLTTYLAALDDRLAVAAPACYISNWEEQLKGTGPQDAEQEFAGQLRNGINHGDFVEVFAPKPYLIGSTTEDFFPIEGSRQTLAEAKKIYALFGAEERISSAVHPGGHGIPAEQLKDIAAWMARWLKPGREPYAGPRPRMEHEEDLWATPGGQLATSLGGETASTLNIKRYAKLRPDRKPLAGAADVEQLRARLRREVALLTSYEPQRGPVNARVVKESVQDGATLSEVVFEPAPGRYVPALLSAPAAGAPVRTVLYVDEAGKNGAPARRDIAELTSLGYTVLALDLSGMGATAPKWGSYSDAWFGNDKIAWLALMVGKPLTGIRMEDITRALDYLAGRGLLPEEGCLGFGAGQAAADLLHTAVMDARIGGLVLERDLLSFHSVARTPVHRQIFEHVVPGVLSRYDYPDLAAAMAPRPVWLANPRHPAGNVVPLAEVRKEYSYTHEAYRACGQPERFSITRRLAGESVAEAYPGLRR